MNKFTYKDDFMVGIPESLIEQLQHPSDNKRSEAVRAIAQIDTADKLEILIEVLQSETDLFVREDITYALTKIGEDAVAPLIELLRDENADIRHAAVHALGKIGHDSAVVAVCAILDDKHTRVVMKAMVALEQIGDAKAIPSLVNLLGHENLEVQSTLLTAFEGFGEVAVSDLLLMLEHEQAVIRERAADALGQIGDQRAIPVLKKLLDDENPEVRFSAKTALHYLGIRD